MRALLIEAEKANAGIVELFLKCQGWNVYTTDCAEEGIDLAKIYDYDVIISELLLPDMSGNEVLRAIRVARVHTPILILSSIVETESKVVAFQLGADDYMTKPADKNELVARLNALVRRSKGHVQARCEIGNTIVNFDARLVSVADKPLHLTRKEYLMIELMALRRGMTVNKEAFLNHLYGGMDEPDAKIVDVFLCKLRKKLRNAGATIVPETVWGRGYYFPEARTFPIPTSVAA